MAFRRTVRVAFGRSSRQYRELLDRRGSAAELEEVEDEAQPGTPAAAGDQKPTA